MILDVSNVVCGLGILIFKQLNKNKDFKYSYKLTYFGSAKSCTLSNRGFDLTG